MRGPGGPSPGPALPTQAGRRAGGAHMHGARVSGQNSGERGVSRMPGGLKAQGRAPGPWRTAGGFGDVTPLPPREARLPCVHRSCRSEGRAFLAQANSPPGLCPTLVSWAGDTSHLACRAPERWGQQRPGTFAEGCPSHRTSTEPGAAERVIFPPTLVCLPGLETTGMGSKGSCGLWVPGTCGLKPESPWCPGPFRGKEVGGIMRTLLPTPAWEVREGLL